MVTFRLGLKDLALFCRQLSVMLNAGLPIRQALATAERSSRMGLRPLYRRIGHAIEEGHTFTEALTREGRTFPLLLRRLTNVGEQVGRLDGVLARSAAYYELLRSIWRRFYASLIWPLFEYWAMWFVLGILAYVRMMLAGKSEPECLRAALLLPALGAAVFVVPILLYYFFTRVLGGQYVTHLILMHIPVVAMVMRTMSLGRFAWAMEMMLDAGVPIVDAMIWATEATGNHVFAARGRRMADELRQGCSIYEVMERARIFPYDFLELVHTGEGSGSLPTMFERLAREYFEKMEQAFKAIGQLAFWFIWLIVATIIIYFIFTIAGEVRNAINQITPGPDVLGPFLDPRSWGWC